MDVYRYMVFIEDNELTESFHSIEFLDSLKFPFDLNFIYKNNICNGSSIYYYYIDKNLLTDEIKNQMYEIALDYIEKQKIKIEKKIKFHKNKIQVLENMKKHKRIVNLFRKQKFKKII